MDRESDESLRIEPLCEPDGLRFGAVYEIYSKTIALSEQKPRQALGAMTQDKNYRIFVAILEEQIVGFSIFYLPLARDFVLLEYMAIEESGQGHGIGGALFKMSIEALQESDAVCPVLMEIDSERDVSADRATRLRRIRFYTKLGCRRVRGLAYIMPSVGNGVPPQMDIYVFWPKVETVARQSVKHWLSTIYAEVYKHGRDDPRIDAMLFPLGDPIPLETVEPFQVSK